MAVFQSENTVRKIDSAGRVIIPKGLRDKLQLCEGDEVNFYTALDRGHYYVAFRKADLIDPRYEIAKEVLEELKFRVPDALEQKIRGGK